MRLAPRVAPWGLAMREAILDSLIVGGGPFQIATRPGEAAVAATAIHNLLRGAAIA